MTNKRKIWRTKEQFVDQLIKFHHSVCTPAPSWWRSRFLKLKCGGFKWLVPQKKKELLDKIVVRLSRQYSSEKIKVLNWNWYTKVYGSLNAWKIQVNNSTVWKDVSVIYFDARNLTHHNLVSTCRRPINMKFSKKQGLTAKLKSKIREKLIYFYIT